MATTDVTEQSPLDFMREEIIKVFERILSEVRSRRDELLEQVSEMKREFETKNISIVESMKELKEMRTQVEKMSVKQNLAMKKQQESLADIDSEIEKLKIDLNNNSKFKFNCSIDQLIEQVKHFGKVIDESCVITNYKSKLAAVEVINKYQNFQFGDSDKLHFDYDKQLLYVLITKPMEVVQPVSRRGYYSPQKLEYFVGVFDASDFTFIAKFGQDDNKACHVATSEEFVYVGFSNFVRQYKNLDYSVVKTSHISSKGIFISSENQVYVLSFSNKTFEFHIYDRALNLKEKRDLCYQWPESEPNISAKQRHELFYILFKGILLVFTQEGKNIHSIFFKEGKTLLMQLSYEISQITQEFVCFFIGKSIINNPTSFCLDEIGNIIVTNSATNSIKFFSPEGDLFHTIGEDTVGSDEVVGATDIVAYKGNVVVLCAKETSSRCMRVY